MHFRRLLASDAAQYYALRAEMLRAHPDAFLTSIDEHLATDIEGIARRLGLDANNHPESQILGALDNDALIACVGLSRITRQKQRHLADIWGVYTHPTARGQGVGKALMQLALKTLRGFGVELVQLGVGSHNLAARALYESAGFVKTGVLPKALRVNGATFDEDHMVCDLATWKAEAG